MPQRSLRASAPSMPRRLFLAVGPAAAVFMALRGAKASAKTALDAKLVEYRKADAAYEAACGQESDAEEAMEPVEPPRWTIADGWQSLSCANRRRQISDLLPRHRGECLGTARRH